MKKEREITWDQFEEQGKHQWVFDDKEYKARYSIRSVDSSIEISIRDELTHDPEPEAIENFLIAVNAYRKHRRIADKANDPPKTGGPST